jgi:hypothetical protein
MRVMMCMMMCTIVCMCVFVRVSASTVFETNLTVNIGVAFQLENQRLTTTVEMLTTRVHAMERIMALQEEGPSHHSTSQHSPQLHPMLKKWRDAVLSHMLQKVADAETMKSERRAMEAQVRWRPSSSERVLFRVNIGLLTLTSL